MSALRDWDAVAAFAAALPGAALSTHYGAPAVKLAANGRAFVATGHEPDTSFVVLIDRDTVELLLATDPATFWQTPHYAGAAAVLVRFTGDDPERVRAVIARARDQAAAARKPARKR